LKGAQAQPRWKKNDFNLKMNNMDYAQKKEDKGEIYKHIKGTTADQW
jgi:hypothetical protein